MLVVGYYGPERPVTVYEIPMECVPVNVQEKLLFNLSAFTDKSWQPKFKAKCT